MMMINIYKVEKKKKEKKTTYMKSYDEGTRSSCSKLVAQIPITVVSLILTE